MMKEQKFFRCKHCGNMVEVLHDSGVPMICCGEPMQLLVANTTDAATEKHVPVVTVSGDTVTVQVGSVLHPMLEEHHIEFVYLKTTSGIYRRVLAVGEQPVATFKLTEDEQAIEAYEYCNLHGLWKAAV